MHQSNASWKVELNASKFLPFLLTAPYPKRAQIQNGEICISGKYVGMGEEPWASFSLELLHPDLQCRWLGQYIHLVSLLSLQNRWGNTSCQKKGYRNHWIFLLALCIDLGCWEEVENGVWDQEGGKSSYLLSNTPDGFSSLDFWIRTCLASTAGVLLSLRQGIVAAKTGQCSLLPWFPWTLDIARYCCWGQSILIWQSKRKAVT